MQYVARPKYLHIRVRLPSHPKEDRASQLSLFLRCRKTWTISRKYKTVYHNESIILILAFGGISDLQCTYLGTVRYGILLFGCRSRDWAGSDDVQQSSRDI